jgi:hypothetical protein
MAKLDSAGIRFCEFREPDKNNEITALATEPICGERRQFFSQFNLLGAEQSVSAPATQGDVQ